MCVRLALLLALLESAALISATPVSFNVQMPNVSPKTVSHHSLIVVCTATYILLNN